MSDTISNDEYNSKKKMVQINTYSEKQYASYLDILKYFTIYCVILLILGILKKRFILSPGFTNILLMVLVIVGGVHLYIKIADANARSNMNFDEYDWTFHPSKQSDPNKLDTNLHDTADNVGASCVEDDCCDPPNTKWCPSTGKCVPGSNYDVACESSEPDHGTGNDTEYNINWNTNLGDCTFPSKTQCADPSKPFYCPVTDSCVNKLTADCDCASYEEDETSFWCPYEGKCVSSECKTQPCEETTASMQSDCGADQQKCDDGVCKQNCKPPDAMLSSSPINCAEVTNSEHPDCVNDNGNHHESFISGISNNFKKFTNSLTNKNKKSIPTRIKSFSKDNNFSYV
jgi:hypothetical protein